MNIYDLINTRVDMRGVTQLDEHERLVQISSSSEEANYINVIDAIKMAQRLQEKADTFTIAKARLMAHIETTTNDEEREDGY